MSSSRNKYEKELYEWIRSFFIIIPIACIVRWGIGELSFVPSESMQNTMFKGDIVFVSKLHYGPRTPMTPLQIPLTHQTLFGTKVKSYSEAIQLPICRLFSLSQVKRNDIVIFNCTYEHNIPIDVRTFFVKRCIGLPGETIHMTDDEVFIDNNKIQNFDNFLFKYNITSNVRLTDSWFEKYGITEHKSYIDKHVVFATKESIKKIKSLKYITSIEKIRVNKNGLFINRFNCSNDCNTANWGPVIIPHKGMCIDITENSNLTKYYETILDDNYGENVKIINNQLFINNEKIISYTFKHDYYFMIGDNRYNSTDSRFFGFVQDDYIVGKAIFILISFDESKKWFDHVRWDRCFKSLQ